MLALEEGQRPVLVVEGASEVRLAVVVDEAEDEARLVGVGVAAQDPLGDLTRADVVPLPRLFERHGHVELLAEAVARGVLPAHASRHDAEAGEQADPTEDASAAFHRRIDALVRRSICGATASRITSSSSPTPGAHSIRCLKTWGARCSRSPGLT